jgi:hypothetical protein
MVDQLFTTSEICTLHAMPKTSLLFATEQLVSIDIVDNLIFPTTPLYNINEKRKTYS